MLESESLKKIWTDWKNVILTTAAVIVVVSSLWWLPPIVGLFEPNAANVQPTSQKITDAMWWIVFILAAQSIFSNRKKRQQMRQAADEGEAQLSAPDKNAADDPKP